MGEQFTIADGYLFTVLSWGPHVNLDIGKWPQLQALVERVVRGRMSSRRSRPRAEELARRHIESRAPVMRPFAVTIGSVQALHVRGRNGTNSTSS